MKQSLFLLTMLFLTGCYSTPTPTPYPLQQYPATWTPAPTPTHTPPGPTATLVIQRTPGAFPTRDPNARIFPNVARGTIGLWADVSEEQTQTAAPFVQRAQILVSKNPVSKLRRSNQFLFLQTDAPDPAALPPDVNGILLKPTTLAPNAIGVLRETAAPRLVLASAQLTDTARLGEWLANADGALLQNFLRAADAPPTQFPSEEAWKQDVENLARVSANPNLILLTELDFPKVGEQDLAAVRQWVQYGLASYLLAVNNTRTFIGVAPAAQPYANLPELEIFLGAPIGGISKQNGVYQRRFVKGLVLVNPTSDPRAFYLPRKYRNANGSVITQLEMPPHTGAILELAE
jgi:hypothetical protein